MAARHEEGCNGGKKNLVTSVVCNRLSNNDVRVARGTVFQEIRSGAGSKTGDLVFKKKVEGATIERSLRRHAPPQVVMSLGQKTVHLYRTVSTIVATSTTSTMRVKVEWLQPKRGPTLPEHTSHRTARSP